MVRIEKELGMPEAPHVGSASRRSHWWNARQQTLAEPRARPRLSFPDLDATTPDERLATLNLLRQHAEDWAVFFIHWYEKRAKNHRALAILLRLLAVVALILGAVIAAGRLLAPPAQRALMEWIGASSIDTVPAELGLMLFALAGGLLAADRFGNLSSNWLRFAAAALVLERRLVEFRLSWFRAALVTPSPARPVTEPPAEPDAGGSVEPSPPADEMLVRFEAINGFLAQTFDLIEQETDEWAKAYRQSQTELQTYLTRPAATERSRTSPAARPGRR